MQEHRYGIDAPSKLIAFMNPVEADEVSGRKAGIENNNTVTASTTSSRQRSTAVLHTQRDCWHRGATQYSGLKIDGSYGPLWIVRSQYIPAGYFAVVATSGDNHPG